MSNELMEYKSAIDILITGLDFENLVQDEVKRRELMNILTILQGANLLDVFRTQAAMGEYVREAITKIYDVNRITAGEDSLDTMMSKVQFATNFMQRYMSYAQKFTQGNQELLVSSERREREEKVSKLLASINLDQLDDAITLLEKLQNHEFENDTRVIESGEV